MFMIWVLFIGLVLTIPLETEGASEFSDGGDGGCKTESNSCSDSEKCCDGLFCQQKDHCQKCLPENDRCWTVDIPGQCCNGGSCKKDKDMVLRCTGGVTEKNIEDCEKKECTDDNVETACTCGVQGAGGLIKFCDKGHCSYCGKYKNYCSFGTTTENGKVECCDKIGRKVDDKDITPNVECTKPGDDKSNKRYRCYMKDGSGILENVKHKTCVHIKNETNTLKGDLDLKKCDLNDQYEQLNVDDWKNYANTPGYIIFKSNGLCATAKDGGTANQVHVVQDKCNNQNYQKWKIQNGKYSGTFQLRNVKSGRCMQKNGKTIDLYDCMALSTSPHHFWKIRVPT